MYTEGHKTVQLLLYANFSKRRPVVIILVTAAFRNNLRMKLKVHLPLRLRWAYDATLPCEIWSTIAKVIIKIKMAQFLWPTV